MHLTVHREAVDLLLASMFQRGDGFPHSFMVQRPGQPWGMMGYGVEVKYRRRELIRTCLFVRRLGPPYLRYMSVEDIWSLLTTFVADTYWCLLEAVFLAGFDDSYAAHVPETVKDTLADLLAASPIFSPTDVLTVFPLVPIKVADNFDSDWFFLVDPVSLDAKRLPPETPFRELRSEQFPPVSNWEGPIQAPSSWLGLRAPLLQVSEKLKAAILGALALTPLHRYRYMRSYRKIFGGRFSFDRFTISLTEPHTPGLAEDIVITSADHDWLSIVAAKALAPERAIRRQIRSLEYFYRAWFLDPRERFPVLCMALDAVFGEANHATQAVIDGVRSTLGEHISDPRLRTLTDLRASVIHGGAPDVYDSRKYARYYDQYDADPIKDLELIVARCLRKLIFNDSLKVHPDPNAEIIEAARAKGRFPKQFDEHVIISESE